MDRITSVNNERIRLAASLLQAKGRREQGLFLLEGPKLIEEALRAGIRVEQLYSTDPVDRPTLSALPCTPVTQPVLEKLCSTVTPQGMVAVARLPKRAPLELKPDGRYILLERLQDAGNVGNILRTAEALGLTGVLFSGLAVDVFSPKVLRGSMGSSLRLPTVSFDTPAHAARTIGAAGLRLWGAALSADAVPIQQAKGNCGVIAVGNEGSGLTPELLALCDLAVIIPMAGETESLSAPSAASILMWELWGRAGM